MIKPVLHGKSFSVANIMAHLRNPLFLNGYALLLSSISTSGLGMVYWVLAARYYTPQQVGADSAILAVMTGIAGASQLGLNTVLARFIPVAGKRVSRFVVYCYLVTIVAATCITLAITLGVSTWSSTLRTLSSNPTLLVIFTLSTIGWAIFTLQDSVLIGLRQSIWVPAENILYAVSKIILLIVFVQIFDQYGIFASWMTPVAVALLPVNLLILQRLIPRHVKTIESQHTSLVQRDVVKFVIGNYPGTLFVLISTTAFPLMITEQVGASGYAYFYMPWMISNALQLIPQNLMTSFLVEASREPTKLWVYCRQVLLQTSRLLVPIVFVIIVGAPLILQVFGRTYADEGITLLRLLAFTSLPNALIFMFYNVARVRNRLSGIIVVQASVMLLDPGLGYVFLQQFGITGVGYSLVISRSLFALGLLVTRLRPVFRRTQPETEVVQGH